MSALLALTFSGPAQARELLVQSQTLTAAKIKALGADLTGASLEAGLWQIDAGPRERAALEELAEVEPARPIWPAGDPDPKLLSLTPDPLFPQQWALGEVANGGIGAAAGWQASKRVLRARPRIAVIDTGIDRSHPDLQGAVRACVASVASKNPDGPSIRQGCKDSAGHGTNVAGIIAARQDQVGVSGLAPNAQLYVCRAIEGDQGEQIDLAACIDWARRRSVDVISMSISGPRSEITEAVIARAEKAGIVLVAAAGNDGQGFLSYPAALPEVISVGASRRSGKISSFSNRNDDVEISAPGQHILSTEPAGQWGWRSGTSQAAPLVSAAAGVLAYLHPERSNLWIEEELKKSSKERGPRGRDKRYGAGLLDFCRLLGAARPDY